TGGEAVDVVVVFLDQRHDLVDVVNNVNRGRAEGDGVASGDGAFNNARVGPAYRLLGAEQDGGVDLLTERLDQSRPDFTEDVVIGVVKHGFRDRHDDGQFLGHHLLATPPHVGGLLQAGIARHPVGVRQRGKDRLVANLAGHPDLSEHREGGRVLRQPLDDLACLLFRNQDVCSGTIDKVVHCHCGSPRQVRPAARRINAFMSLASAPVPPLPPSPLPAAARNRPGYALRAWAMTSATLVGWPSSSYSRSRETRAKIAAGSIALAFAAASLTATFAADSSARVFQRSASVWSDLSAASRCSSSLLPALRSWSSSAWRDFSCLLASRAALRSLSSADLS